VEFHGEECPFLLSAHLRLALIKSYRSRSTSTLAADDLAGRLAIDLVDSQSQM
jgi:hypothetical protein